MFLLGWRLLYTRVQKTRKALLQGLGEQNANAEFLDFLMIMMRRNQNDLSNSRHFLKVPRFWIPTSIGEHILKYKRFEVIWRYKYLFSCHKVQNSPMNKKHDEGLCTKTEKLWYLNYSDWRTAWPLKTRWINKFTKVHSDIQQVFWLAKHDKTYKIKIFSVLFDFVRICTGSFNEEKAQ